MKTEKELQELKEKVESLNKELQELTEEELAQVSGGFLNGHEMHILGNNPYGILGNNPYGILGNNPYGAVKSEIISAGH